MHRLFAVAAALLLLLAASSRLVTAQDADGAEIPAIGEPVPFIGQEGTEVARLTVTEVVDPFEDYDASFGAPERGQHFVMVRLDVENTGTRPFPIDPSAVRLQDSDGFLYSYTFVSRSAEESESDPDLAFVEVPAGDTASGPIFFSVVNDVELVRVLFTPDFDRLVFLADLTLLAAATPVPAEEEEATPAADATEGAGADATEVAVVDGDCAAAEEWYTDTTTNLSGGVLSELPSSGLADLSAEELDEIAAGVADAVAAQEALDVPPAAEAASELILQALDDYATAIDQAIAADGDDAALDEAEQALQDAVNFIFTDVFNEVNALATECGFEA